VIPQLEASFTPSLTGVSISVSGGDAIELAPFPVPALSRGVSSTIFGRSGSAVESFLVSGESCGVGVDFVVATRASDSAAIPALFAFMAIESLERQLRRGDSTSAVKANLVRLSLEHGILCSETAFVGFSEAAFGVEMDCSGGASGAFGAYSDNSDMDDMCCYEAMSEYFSGAGTGGSPECCAMAPCCDMCDCDSFDAMADCQSCASAAPAPAAAPPHEARRVLESDPLIEVVELQGIDGSWSEVDPLLILSRKVEADFAAVEAASGGRRTVFATVLAVAILRVQCQARKAAWRLVEQKALDWLVRVLGVLGEAEALIGLAVAAF
jgi:hypothetical protein